MEPRGTKYGLAYKIIALIFVTICKFKSNYGIVKDLRAIKELINIITLQSVIIIYC